MILIFMVDECCLIANESNENALQHILIHNTKRLLFGKIAKTTSWVNLASLNNQTKLFDPSCNGGIVLSKHMSPVVAVWSTTIVS